MRRSLEATAFHEAGRAVQAHFERIRIRSVTCEPGDGAAGVVRTVGLRFRDGELSATALARHARVSLAGHVAQRRHRPSSIRLHHASADREAASEFARRISGSNAKAEAYLKLWIIQVEQKIAFAWPMVEAVAAALLERGTLDAEFVTTTCQREDLHRACFSAAGARAAEGSNTG